MDPYDETSRGRLAGKNGAMRASFSSLEPFRNLVRGLVDEYTGPAYGSGRKTQKEILLNLSAQAVDAYTMSLAANRPRVLISSRKRELVYFARHYQEAINNLIEEIGLEYTIRGAVLDAFFCVGIVKIHLADSAPVELEQGLWMDPGQPFASCVSLDNWCHDMTAQRFDQVKFAADSYRIPFSDLSSDVSGDLYDQDVVREVTPTSKHGMADDERLEKITRSEETDGDEFEPMVDLMDVWIPRDQKVYTFAMDATDRFTTQHPPLAVMDWTGPEHGPYRILSFQDVPENIMPISKASHLAGLARLANNLMRKQSRQANRQRDVNIFTSAGADAAKSIKRAGDGEWVKVDDVKEVGVHKIGGVDQTGHAFTLGVIQMFDRMSNNLGAKLGLGPQSDTVGQDKLIHGAVSASEANLQNRTIDFSRGLIKDLGKMLWDDRVKIVPGQIQVEGAPQYSADTTWRPDHREGQFEDYDLDVDVFSMSHQSPQERAQALNQLITGIYIPMGQMLAQQGGTINLQKLTEIYAELMNLPRLREVIQFITPEPNPESAQGPKKGSHTSREYVRKSVSTGGTMQGRAHVQEQAWLNSGQNNQDQTALSQAV